MVLRGKNDNGFTNNKARRFGCEAWKLQVNRDAALLLSNYLPGLMA